MPDTAHPFFHAALRVVALPAALVALAACRPEPPPTEQPPEPQAHAELRDAIQAPQDKAREVEKTVQDSADRQQAEIEAATGS